MSNQIDKTEKLFNIEDLERVIESLRIENERCNSIITKTCFLIAECKLAMLIQSKAPSWSQEELNPSN